MLGRRYYMRVVLSRMGSGSVSDRGLSLGVLDLERGGKADLVKALSREPFDPAGLRQKGPA